ncbi:MAG: c-type cytochrome [Alphaproteobacteria bacterium]|nr:c-type cytochrome [Alphaproteobacteria bacterium]
MKRIVVLLLLAAAPALAQPKASTNPFLGNPQAVAEGKATYDRYCTACHGPDATAGERAPAIVLSGAGTALRGERSIDQIVAVVRNGIPGTGMPAWGTRISSDDILKLGAYVNALRGTAMDNPLPGDPAHGEQVFWGKGQCGTCHMINGRGGVTGPDLSNIAAVRKTTAIVNALTKVEHRVFGDGGVHLPAIPPMDYDPVQVVTKDGRTIDGVMRNQDHWSVQFIGMDGTFHSFDRDELTSVTIRPGSIMPTDYDKRLSPDEFRDLLAFLTRQGHKQTADAQ